MANEADAPVETDPTGRFTRFKSILGRGAYKTVYRAFDTDEALEVAWNKLHVERLSKHDLEKVSNEVELLKRVNHKNIIRFYHTWTNPAGNGAQTIDFITEQMTSGTLKDYLKKAGAIKLKVIRRWCSNILEAIAYLHAQNPPIMHRDLKCENIFINGHVGEVKIGDLGLSGVKVRDKADSVIGTPEFMAPELYEECYTEKVDIYAFGMCLLEMVAMEYPYSECTNYVQIFKKVFNDERPLAFDRIVDCDVKNVIAACLQREANRPSAAELLQDPLFKDWQQDDGEESNLSLLRRSRDGTGRRTVSSRSNGTGGYGANVIDWSDQLDRTLLVSMPSGGAGHEVEQGTNVSVVASQANETGAFTLGLEIPFGDKIKGVQFTFDPFEDNPRRIAQEMVNEFHLSNDQLIVIEEEIERQVRSAREQREAASRNATPQPAARSAPSAVNEKTDAEQPVSQGGEPQPAPPQQPVPQQAVHQPIEALRTPNEQETAGTSQPEQTQSATGVAPDNVLTSSTIVETGPVEGYIPNDAPVPQPHSDIVQPVHAKSEHLNVQNEPQEQLYHHEMQPSQNVHQAMPAEVDRRTAIPSSNASDSGYYSGPTHDQEQGLHFQAAEKNRDVEIESRMHPHPVSLSSVHLETQDRSSNSERNSNSSMHMHHQIGVPADGSLPYSQVSSSSQGNPSPEFVQGSVEDGTGRETGCVPHPSSQPTPAQPALSETTGAPPVYAYHGRDGSPSGEFVDSHPPQRHSHTLSFAEPPEQGVYSDESASHQGTNVEELRENAQGRSSGSGRHHSTLAAAPASGHAVSSEPEHSVPAPTVISHSASEHQIRAISSVSPHRTVSAPVGTIVIDDSADYSGLRHGSSPMPKDMVPLVIPNLQSAADGSQAKSLASGVEHTSTSHSGTSSVPSSRPPSIVVVGGERRSSTRDKRHMSVPSLSAKSLPEYGRNEGSKVPRSASLMSNVADASRYAGSRDKEAVFIPGTNSFSGQASASPSAMSRRSSSWRSSQSDESTSDVALRVSTSDSVLGTSFDQRGLAACLELMEHCAKGRYSSVLQKLDQGTPAQFADYDKRTPLHLASARGHMEVCILLLDRGANVSARDRWGRTPISDAKSNRHEAVIDLLKKHGAVEDIDMSSDVASLQLLQYAAKGDLEALRGRIVAGAKATYADYDQRTALHLACTEGHAEVAELLLVNNADPAALDSLGRTPVDDAVTNGHRNVLRVLRQYGAEIPRHLMGAHSDSQYQLGLDLVENAAKGRTNAVRKCLRTGANPSFQDYDKRTPLHLAAVEGNIDIVEILLLAGANPSIRDRWGATPRDEALKDHHTAVVDELDNWGKRMAEKNASSKDARLVSNGVPSRGPQSLRGFNAPVGPDGEDLRSTTSSTATLSSFAMHPDMFVQTFPATQGNAPVMDSQKGTRSPLPSSASFEKQSEERDGEIDEQERILQAEYNEKLRKLRESRYFSKTSFKRQPTDQAKSSTVSWRQSDIPPPRAMSTPPLSVAIPPRPVSPVISEVPSTGPVAECGTEEADLSGVEKPMEGLEEGNEEKAEVLASEIVDNIIDQVVQDSSESEGNVM